MALTRVIASMRQGRSRRAILQVCSYTFLIDFQFVKLAFEERICKKCLLATGRHTQ
jgi:hypothetical protein